MLKRHTYFLSITGVCTLMIEHCIFSIMAGLMLFMLFSVHNIVQWAESKSIRSVLANRFSAKVVHCNKQSLKKELKQANKYKKI